MNFESIPINFCNKKTLNIKSDEYKQYLLDFIKSNYKIDIMKKTYRRYREENLNIVENNKSILSTVSIGYTYWMFMFKDDYSMKPRCYMIEGRIAKGYKYPKIMTVFTRFTPKVFSGTLLKGELIRDKNNDWIYLIDDMPVYCNEIIKYKTKIDRIDITNKLLVDEFYQDNVLQLFTIKMKKYFKPNQVNEIVDTFIPSLTYPCRGIMIHTQHKIYNNLYINFDDDKTIRTPKKVSSPNRYNKMKTENTNVKNITIKVKKPTTPVRKETTNMFKNLDSIKIKVDAVETKINTETKHNVDYDKSNCVVLSLVKTDKPDVYKLYANKDDKSGVKRVAYANIPNIETSKYIQNIFSELSETENKFNIMCEYNHDTKKWTPKEKVNVSEPDIVSLVKSLKKKFK